MTTEAAENHGDHPIDMILHCPKCGTQHIDGKEFAVWERRGGPPGNQLIWNNPPHRSHLCHGCGHIWRPADVPTNGVAEIKTRGKNDSPKPGPIKFSITIRGDDREGTLEGWLRK